MAKNKAEFWTVLDMDAWLDQHIISTPKTVIRAMKKNTVNAQKDMVTLTEGYMLYNLP